MLTNAYIHPRRPLNTPVSRIFRQGLQSNAPPSARCHAHVPSSSSTRSSSRWSPSPPFSPVVVVVAKLIIITNDSFTVIRRASEHASAPSLSSPSRNVEVISARAHTHTHQHTQGHQRERAPSSHKHTHTHQCTDTHASSHHQKIALIIIIIKLTPSELVHARSRPRPPTKPPHAHTLSSVRAARVPRVYVGKH